MPKTIQAVVKEDHLLDEGIRLFWSNGYNGTSINDIVKAADVPKGSFYFYFKSKEDFAVKAIEKYFDESFSPALILLKDTSITPKQRLINFYEFRLSCLKDKLNCSKGCMGCNLANEMSEHSEAIRLAVDKREKSIRDYLEDVVKQAQDNNEISKELSAEEIVMHMEDAGKGAMITMKAMQSAFPVDNFLKVIKHIILK